MREIVCQPLTSEAFAPYGDVLDCNGTPDRMINAGLCGRYHDRAQLSFGQDGRAGISIFRAEARALPYSFDLLERHPEGSQAFIPMSADPFLVIAAPDENGRPGAPVAFLTAPFQGINFFAGTWHGVLTPLSAPGIFAVVDRIGDTANLEEHKLSTPVTVIT